MRHVIAALAASLLVAGVYFDSGNPEDACFVGAIALGVYLIFERETS